MTITKTRQTIERIKDELRKQASSWNYQLMCDRAMNLALQRKVENAIEKSKIVQKLRIRHAERLLNDIEFGNAYKHDVESEFKTYWSVIVPEIKEALLNFKEINSLKNIEDRIDKIEVNKNTEVPETIDVLPDPPQEPESETKSQTLESAHSVSESTTFRSGTGSLAHSRSLARRGKSKTRHNR